MTISLLLHFHSYCFLLAPPPQAPRCGWGVCKPKSPRAPSVIQQPLLGDRLTQPQSKWLFCEWLPWPQKWKACSINTCFSLWKMPLRHPSLGRPLLRPKVGMILSQTLSSFQLIMGKLLASTPWSLFWRACSVPPMFGGGVVGFKTQHTGAGCWCWY